MESQANLRSQIPSKSTANHTGTEVVETSFWVSQHDCEVLRDVVQNHVERMSTLQVGRSSEDAIMEKHVLFVKVEVLRVTSTEELEAHFHQLFACVLGAW